MDPRQAAQVLAPTVVLRPIDLSRLLPAAGKGPCSPVQVAKFVWTAPDCSSAANQPLSLSPFVAKHARGPAIPLPADVDLRAQGLDGPVKNQQMVGVCWAFALSTVMDNALRRNGRPDVVSPLHVIASNPWDDIWQRGRSERALTVESAWPYDPVKGCKLNEAKSEIWCGEAYHVTPGSWRSDPELVVEVDHAHRSGVHRIRRIATLQVQPADTHQIASALAAHRAVFASFAYNRLAWSDFASPGPVIPDYEQTDGGHAVVLVGYRSTPAGRQFLIHNSWGTDWRAGGYAWISDAMVRRHVKDAFTVEVESSSGAAPPGAPQAAPSSPAGPRPEPTPLGSQAATCPEGQARDTVFGWCAPRCPSGAAPTALLCPQAAPSPATSSPCPAGHARDWLGGQCVRACASGLPPVGPLCLP